MIATACSDEDVLRVKLRSVKHWRVLWAYEAGQYTPTEAAQRLGITVNDFLWFRSLAFEDLREREGE